MIVDILLTFRVPAYGNVLIFGLSRRRLPCLLGSHSHRVLHRPKGGRNGSGLQSKDIFSIENAFIHYIFLDMFPLIMMECPKIFFIGFDTTNRLKTAILRHFADRWKCLFIIMPGDLSRFGEHGLPCDHSVRRGMQGRLLPR